MMGETELYLSLKRYENSSLGLILKFRDVLDFLPEKVQPFDDFFSANENFRPRSKHYLEDGVAQYLRTYLSYWFDEDRARVRQTAQTAETVIDRIDVALGAIEKVLNTCTTEDVTQALATQIRTRFILETEMERSARWKGYWKNLKSLESAFGTLVALRNIAREKVEVCRTDPRRHNEKQFWKHDFVAFVAQLWRNLFSEYPSVAPDSRFADFLACIWSAIDPGDEFPQSWDRTIREVVGELKQGRSRT